MSNIEKALKKDLEEWKRTKKHQEGMLHCLYCGMLNHKKYVKCSSCGAPRE